MTEAYGYISAIVAATRGRLAEAAISFEGNEQSWQSLLDRAARLAAGLRSLGVVADDRVAVLAHNSDRYLELYLAIPWCGAVAAHLNWRWNVLENVYAIEDSTPKVLFVDDEVSAEDREKLKAAMPSLIVVALGANREGTALAFDDLLAHAPIRDAGRAGDDVLAIYYTGGTTGRSKGVTLSHDGVIRNCVNCRSLGMMPDGARVLAVAPLMHLGAGSCVTLTMLAGGTVVLDKGFDPERALQLIEQCGVTDAFLVPTMVGMLIDHPTFRPERFAKLRRIVYGSSPISAETLDQALNVAPHIDFYQAYGMTEACSAATVLPPEYHVGEHRAAGHHRAAGFPIPEVKLQIVDEQGSPVPSGTVGEVWIGGRTLMLRYWGQPEVTKAALRDGWMRSGDGGYMDENGLLYIVDRMKDMIVSGGENVYSGEVENALSHHPAVMQCAVIGVPDERWGERVHAIVSVRPGHSVTEEEIIDHCRQLIGRFKCPRSVEFWSQPLPLSAVGKIMKQELRAKHWQGRSRQVA